MTAFMQRPQWLQHFNQFGTACRGAEHLVSLEPGELRNTAMAAVGLSDFGDLPWEEGFERLVWSMNNEARLNVMGRLMTRAELLRTLQVRLLLTDFWKANPDVLKAEVKPPIVIAGAARTGTSILQEVLSEDDQFHVPYTWRCLNPLPLGEDRETDIAQRLEAGKCEAEFWCDVQPELLTMHENASRLPTECLIFMSQDYGHDYWGMVAELPSWQTWRHENNYFLNSYTWHKRILQTMQWGEPQDRVWLLKSPAHLIFLDIMQSFYPGVNYIHTHRDPLKSIPSTANVSATMRWERSDNVDFTALIQDVVVGFRYAMEKVIDQRESGELPAAHITDVHLRGLLRDPVATVASVYQHFDLDFTGVMEQKVLDYLANKPQGKFGKHSYDTQRFGIDLEQLRADYKRYSDHYGIELEE